MELNQEKIIAEVRNALNLTYRSNILAASRPLPQPPLEAKPCIQMDRFIFPVSGEKVIRFAEKRKDIRRVFVPGEILQVPSSAWDVEVWERDHKMISIVLRPNYLRVIFIEHHAAAPPPQGPDYFYHTTHPLDRAGIEIFNAMSHLSVGAGATDALFHAFLRVVLEQLEMEDPVPRTKENLTWEYVRNYVESNFSGAINRESIAAAVRLHPAHLSRLFLKRTGAGVAEYITNLRMEHALRLLSDPKISIGEIADLCGYSSASYFIRVFRQNYLVSPMKYREGLFSVK